MATLEDLAAQIGADMKRRPAVRVVESGTDVNTIREPGLYVVSSTAVAATLINWPSLRAGTLLVGRDPSASMTTQVVVLYVSTTEPTEHHSRATISSSNTSWGPWGSSEWVKGTLTGTAEAPVNVDTYRTPGFWAVPSRANIEGLPGSGLGYLEVVATTKTGLRLQRFIERVANDNIIEWARYSLTASGWAGVAWARTAPEPVAPVEPVEPISARVTDVQISDHATRVEYARARRGGGIGTGGKAVVMLRFDHWLAAFRDNILPILRQYSLPATLNVNHDNLALEANGGGSITWSEVQDWNQYDGIEIANHGRTHNDQTTMANIYREVVEGRRLLEQEMPRIAVETWQEHGSAYLVAGDLDGDTGLNLGRTPSSFTESYAGRLVMAEHAIVEGKSGGFFPPLTGMPQVGQSHMSMDRFASDPIAQVGIAQQMRRGVTLYWHPGSMDQVVVGGSFWPVTRGANITVTNPTTGDTQSFADDTALQAWADSNGHIVNSTLAQFEALCAHLAAERDAGRLMVMTAAGGGFADKSHDRRENLFLNPRFENGSQHWVLGGWSVTNPGDAPTLTGPGTLSQNMLLYSRYGWAMGATHELVVTASGEGTLTLSGQQLGNPTNWGTSRTFTLTGEPREYRLIVTLPNDRDISQLTWRITASGTATITGQPLLAAI